MNEPKFKRGDIVHIKYARRWNEGKVLEGPLSGEGRGWGTGSQVYVVLVRDGHNNTGDFYTWSSRGYVISEKCLRLVSSAVDLSEEL